MEESEIDPSLAELVEEIEAAEAKAFEEPKDTTPKVEPAKEDEKSHVEEDGGFDENLEINDQPEPDDYEDEDEEEVETIADVVIEPEREVVSDFEKEQQELQQSVLGMLKKHCNSSEKMIEEAECDRRKIDDILGMILPKIQNDDYRAADIGTVAQLMQIKSEISRNRASTMDSISKLFAALKGNDSIGVKAAQKTEVSQEEVTKLLSNRDSD
jgi:hypothetical protein